MQLSCPGIRGAEEDCKDTRAEVGYYSTKPWQHVQHVVLQMYRCNIVTPLYILNPSLIASSDVSSTTDCKTSPDNKGGHPDEKTPEELSSPADETDSGSVNHRKKFSYERVSRNIPKPFLKYVLRLSCPSDDDHRIAHQVALCSFLQSIILQTLSPSYSDGFVVDLPARW